MNDNYSDDIRSWDDSPDSPFYSEPDCCEVCDEQLECDIGDIDVPPYAYCDNSNCEKYEVIL